MIIYTNNVKGNNIIERNKNRIRRIKLEQQRNKEIDNMYNQDNFDDFKKILCDNVMFEVICNKDCIRIYNNINREQFKFWYNTRGTKGIQDLIVFYKLYKK